MCVCVCVFFLFFFYIICGHCFNIGTSSYSFSAFSARSLGFIVFGEIFVYVTVFYPTIEVFTLRLSGQH